MSASYGGSALDLLCQRGDFGDVALPCPFLVLPASLSFFCPPPVS